MMLLRWHALLSLWLCANAETIVLYRESGDGVTLRCSLAECSSSIEGFSGMYLYKKFIVLEEVLYHSSKPGSPTVVTPREPFKNRTQVDGTLQDQNITIGNLTVHDSGFYSCVFISFPEGKVKCNTYMLAVKGVPCDKDTTSISGSAVKAERPSLVLPVAVTCAVTTLVILACLLLKRLVKKWMRDCRRVRNPPEPNDYVYEVMTKEIVYSLPAPQQQHHRTVPSL
ncbi:uncharacterized protein LOC142899359 [Nelusetta ayraudi]|uniref:uncharacterized protein LOC142899359 n=1 Tax=Nelusetta ayraudi TaxID=303726 RepID=UPI003F717114